MKNLCFIFSKLVLALLVIFSNNAFAEQCASGGPVTLEHSPALPSQFILTGRANGDILWSGSIIVSFKGCRFAFRTGSSRLFVDVTTGATAGIDIRTSTGAESGLMIRQATTAATVTGLPAGCSSGAANTGSNRTRILLCGTSATSFTYSNTVVTFPGVVISVKDKNAPSSTLNNSQVACAASSTCGILSPWGLVTTNAFATYLYTGADTMTYLAPASSVVQATCTVSPSDITVALPTVSQSALTRAGSYTGLTPFSMKLIGCSNGGMPFSVTSTWAFAEGANNTNIANSASGPAANVETQILDDLQSPISSSSSVSLGSVPSAGGSLIKNFFARYVSTGTASAGAVQGIATYTLSYQ